MIKLFVLYDPNDPQPLKSFAEIQKTGKCSKLTGKTLTHTNYYMPTFFTVSCLRGQGYGKEMLKRIEEHLSEKTNDKYTIEITSATDPQVKNLYFKHGKFCYVNGNAHGNTMIYVSKGCESPQLGCKHREE